MMHGMHGQGGGYDKAYITCLLYVECLGDQQGPTDRIQHIQKPLSHNPYLDIQRQLSLLPLLLFYQYLYQHLTKMYKYSTSLQLVGRFACAVNNQYH